MNVRVRTLRKLPRLSFLQASSSSRPVARSSTALLIRVNDRVLPARLYPKAHAQLAPGVVVDYPHLDGVFAWIAAQQQERDAARLANPKISGREKRRIRAGSAPRTPAPSPE